MLRFILSLLILVAICAGQANAQWEYPNGWSVGTIKPQGIIYPVSSTTTNQTLTVYQSATLTVYTGSVAHGQFTLPVCQNTLGLEYTFIDDTTNFISVLPQSTDTIKIASTIQGQGVNNSSATAIGNNITLICRSNNTWSIADLSGTWATGN